MIFWKKKENRSSVFLTHILFWFWHCEMRFFLKIKMNLWQFILIFIKKDCRLYTNSILCETLTFLGSFTGKWVKKEEMGVIRIYGDYPRISMCESRVHTLKPIWFYRFLGFFLDEIIHFLGYNYIKDLIESLQQLAKQKLREKKAQVWLA